MSKYQLLSNVIAELAKVLPPAQHEELSQALKDQFLVSDFSQPFKVHDRITSLIESFEAAQHDTLFESVAIKHQINIAVNALRGLKVRTPGVGTCVGCVRGWMDDLHLDKENPLTLEKIIDLQNENMTWLPISEWPKYACAALTSVFMVTPHGLAAIGMGPASVATTLERNIARMAPGASYYIVLREGFSAHMIGIRPSRTVAGDYEIYDHNAGLKVCKQADLASELKAKLQAYKESGEVFTDCSFHHKAESARPSLRSSAPLV